MHNHRMPEFTIGNRLVLEISYVGGMDAPANRRVIPLTGKVRHVPRTVDGRYSQ